MVFGTSMDHRLDHVKTIFSWQLPLKLTQRIPHLERASSNNITAESAMPRRGTNWDRDKNQSLSVWREGGRRREEHLSFHGEQMGTLFAHKEHNGETIKIAGYNHVLATWHRRDGRRWRGKRICNGEICTCRVVSAMVAFKHKEQEIWEL